MGQMPDVGRGEPAHLFGSDQLEKRMNIKPIGWIAIVLAASGCATTRMAVPADLANAPEWSVRARSLWRPDAPLRVGPYEAHRIDRHGIRQRGGIVDALKGKKEYQQRYEFLLRDTAERRDLWAVRCDNRDVEQGIRLGSVELSLDDRTSLECSIQPPGEPARAWALRMRGSDDGAPAGRLTREEVSYQVEGESAPGPQTDCCEALGYVLRRDGRVLGAVENLDRGRVRVAPDVGADEGSLIAATALALILQSKLIEGD
jgi:hypothetical protein